MLKPLIASADWEVYDDFNGSEIDTEKWYLSDTYETGTYQLEGGNLKFYLRSDLTAHRTTNYALFSQNVLDAIKGLRVTYKINKYCDAKTDYDYTLVRSPTGRVVYRVSPVRSGFSKLYIGSQIFNLKYQTDSSRGKIFYDTTLHLNNTQKSYLRAGTDIYLPGGELPKFRSNIEEVDKQNNHKYTENWQQFSMDTIVPYEIKSASSTTARSVIHSNPNFSPSVESDYIGSSRRFNNNFGLYININRLPGAENGKTCEILIDKIEVYR